jgi:energy-coupling factor transporter ATP-binding protein EcfA2
MTFANHEVAATNDQKRNGPRRTAIRIAHLFKRYGAIEAVRGIEFEIANGEIFGLIGPDGAGKTSTFQILAGVMEASGGVAEVLGRLARQARSAHPHGQGEAGGGANRVAIALRQQKIPRFRPAICSNSLEELRKLLAGRPITLRPRLRHAVQFRFTNPSHLKTHGGRSYHATNVSAASAE